MLPRCAPTARRMLNSRDVLAGVVSQQAVEAGGRHQDGDDGEDAGKDGEQALLPERIGDLLLHGFHVAVT